MGKEKCIIQFHAKICRQNFAAEDPLQWLWSDLAKFGDKMNYVCSDAMRTFKQYFEPTELARNDSACGIRGNTSCSC